MLARGYKTAALLSDSAALQINVKTATSCIMGFNGQVLVVRSIFDGGYRIINPLHTHRGETELDMKRVYIL